MTPLELGILLHYYVSGEDYRQGDFSAPAVSETVERFLRSGMLRERTEAEKQVMNIDQIYTTTERADTYILAVLQTPLPVQIWTIPEEMT